MYFISEFHKFIYRLGAGDGGEWGINDNDMPKRV